VSDIHASTIPAPAAGRRRGRASLQAKHALVIAILVCGSLLMLGATDLYFSYQEVRFHVSQTQSAYAARLAGSIEAALRLVQRHLASVVMLPLDGVAGALDSIRREEYLRLLRLAPSVESIQYIDATGNTMMTVSRREVDSLRPADTATPPGNTTNGAVAYSTVQYANDYEPFLTVSISDTDRGGGRTIARLNLRALGNEVQESLDVETAYVVDTSGRVVLHRDPSVVLERRDLRGLEHVSAALRHDISGLSARDSAGASVIASSHALKAPKWVVIVEQRRAIAMEPVQDMLLRAGGFFAAGLVLSIVAAYYLAGRLTKPILLLHKGVDRMVSGEYGANVEVRTGDELEELGDQFNRMAAAVAESHTSLEQRVAEKTRDLEIANRHKSEVLANVSHELRTPLNAIISMSQALVEQEMFGPLNAKQLQYAAEINGAGKDLFALINDLLDLAKIEAGKLELSLSTVRIAELVDGAVRLLHERAARRGVHVTTEIAADVDRWNVDERRLKQILLNLLSNAIKFTRPGGSIRVVATKREAWLALEVADTGIGISKEELELVFEPFRQAARQGADSEGTGLGLPLVRRFVDLHRGRLEVRSEVGVGSTFIVLLPPG